MVVIPARNLWVNPDCGLKTRKWEETEQVMKNMVEASKKFPSYTNDANERQTTFK